MGREDSFRAVLHGILLLMNFFAFDGSGRREIKTAFASDVRDFPKQELRES